MIPRFKPDINHKEILGLFNVQDNAVEHFENIFKRKFKAVDAIAFPYGRSAQWAFFKSLNIKNSEIIMPAYTCSVVAHAISLSGNKPKFIDINLADYNMDLNQLENSINENTRAIIATHTFGYPQNIEWIEDIIKRAEKRFDRKIWFINDCCHAFGAKWKETLIGSSGDVAVYAFNISKLITSIFGGILTFQDKSLASKVRSFRDKHYKSPSWNKKISRRIYLLLVYFLFNKKSYDFLWYLKENTTFLDHLTKSYHLDNKIHFPPDYLDLMLQVEASVGAIQLQKYDSIIRNRIKKAYEYDLTLPRKEGWIFPPIIKGATYSHYTVRVKNRAKVIKDYAAKGIELGELIQYSIPHLSSYWEDGYNNKFPNSLEASKSTINFPL